MTKSKVLIIGIAAFFLGCTAAQISQTTNMLDNALVKKDSTSTLDVGNGLKEALVQGVSKGSAQASQLDGYFKNDLLKSKSIPMRSHSRTTTKCKLNYNDFKNSLKKRRNKKEVNTL